jgi:hypothetical protein
MSGAQKFNGHLDPKEPVSGVGVWKPRQIERVTRQFQVVSGARGSPHQTMLKVQLWHKQHLKDQTEARTSSTKRKFNALGVLVVGNGQRKEVFWERVTIHYNSNQPFALNPKNERNL